LGGEWGGSPYTDAGGNMGQSRGKISFESKPHKKSTSHVKEKAGIKRKGGKLRSSKEDRIRNDKESPTRQTRGEHKN